MTDLHTHILPGIDDGAKDVEMSLAMLREEKRQGVKAVVLTPHFYRHREEPEVFLRHRAKALQVLEEKIAELPEREKNALPRRVPGAEVAWSPDILEWDEIEQLCIGNTQNLLLELPFTPWNTDIINRLYNLMGRTGITPVIAHIDRYIDIQSKNILRDIFELDIPVQLGSDSLFHTMTRGAAMKLIKKGRAHFIASDCHNMTDRAPNMKAALDVVCRKLGGEAVDSLLYTADSLLEE